MLLWCKWVLLLLAVTASLFLWGTIPAGEARAPALGSSCSGAALRVHSSTTGNHQHKNQKSLLSFTLQEAAYFCTSHRLTDLCRSESVWWGEEKWKYYPWHFFSVSPLKGTLWSEICSQRIWVSAHLFSFWLREIWICLNSRKLQRKIIFKYIHFVSKQTNNQVFILHFPGIKKSKNYN